MAEFEKAIRLKLRFPSPQGLLTVEDLWDLPLTSTGSRASLNGVAKAVNATLKAAAEEDFVGTAKRADVIPQLQLDIVKHVIATRQAENADALAASEKREKKARLLELIAKKQDQELEGKSLEDLQALVAGL